MGVGERPEKHLVSMSLPHSRIILGSVPILYPALHALSKRGYPQLSVRRRRVRLSTRGGRSHYDIDPSDIPGRSTIPLLRVLDR